MKYLDNHWIKVYNDIYDQFGDRSSARDIILLAILGVLIDVLRKLEE